MNNINLKNREIIKYIILLLFITHFIATFFYDSFTEELDYLIITTEQSKHEWTLNILKSIPLQLGAFLFVIFSIYIKKYSTSNLKANLLIASSIALTTVYLSTSIFGLHIISNTQLSMAQIIQNTDHSERAMNIILNNKYTIEKKSELTKQLASLQYIKTAINLEVMDKNGKISLYIPTQSDLVSYHKTIRHIEISNHFYQSVRSGVIWWSTNLILSILAGLLLILIRNKIKK
ncbi:MAG: hypothetical protein HRU38_19940 [Saccharospirillaceae bacterium]|nr:hypothetical protein [Pseudomonadales bacterium]NRB80905.1 hypothetical protein [Saccharospirillaceae bacterium]